MSTFGQWRTLPGDADKHSGIGNTGPFLRSGKTIVTLNISTKLRTDTLFFQSLIDEISVGRIKIPKFQRPYVWKAPQALKLLDSVYRSYPIGSLLIWRTQSTLKTERQFGNFTLPQTPHLMPTDYVLDGQQRLTVIYSCLAHAAAVGGFDVVFDLEMLEFRAADEVSPGVTLFPLRKVFVTTELLNFRTALQAHKDAGKLQAALDELIAAFTQYKLPVTYLKDLQLDEVCPIFERINSSGTKLSTYDLMVAATWSNTFDLDESVSQIAMSLGPKGFDDIDRITVVKCMSALHSGSIKEAAIYDLRNISAANLAQLTKRTQEGLLRAVDSLSTEFGVYSWDFLSYEALVVIMCALFADNKILTPDQHKRLRRWFWRASWSERYKAGGENFVSKDIDRVSSFVFNNVGIAPDFGAPPGDGEWRRSYFRMNASRSRALALTLASLGPQCLLNGAAIDVVNALSSFNKKQFHHIWPRNYLKKAKSDDDNLLVNICLLPAAANIKISDQDPNKYLPELTTLLGADADKVFASNAMPKPSQFDYSKATYQEFVSARLQILSGAVTTLCD